MGKHAAARMLYVVRLLFAPLFVTHTHTHTAEAIASIAYVRVIEGSSAIVAAGVEHSVDVSTSR